MKKLSKKYQNIKAVIFDLDGTLLDSFSVHFEVYKTVFAKFGINLGKSEFLKSYSPNWYETYKAVGLPEEKWGLVNSLWVEEANKINTLVFEGTKEILDIFSNNFILGIVTSGSKSRVEKDLLTNGIKKYFNSIITGDDIKYPKPHPQGLELALFELKLNGMDAVYIGDAYDDFKMAKSAGTSFIGIKSKFNNLQKDHPQYDLYNLSDLPTIFGIDVE
jgi:HAD superfamily hydrolase (TIGR01549 family)